MKYYVSGPIAGANFMSREQKLAQFEVYAEQLRAEGHEVLNPLDVDACPDQSCGEEDGHSWGCYLRYDLIAMLEQCDAIFMLPGWLHSKGALLEHDIASRLGWDVEYAKIEDAE